MSGLITVLNLPGDQPPHHLANAHRTLDEAVFAAYGWPASLTTPESNQKILARLLTLNHQRAATLSTKPTTPSRSATRKPKKADGF